MQQFTPSRFSELSITSVSLNLSESFSLTGDSIQRESAILLDYLDKIDSHQTFSGSPNIPTEDLIQVFVRTCYEQWGRWRNYHLFKIFSTFKNEARVRFSVELVLPKMAMEISVNERLVYSRLMKSGYHNCSNLTDFVVSQINMALTGKALTYITTGDYNAFLAQFRRRISDCMDKSDMPPGDEGKSTLNSLRDKGTTMGMFGKGTKKKTIATNSTN